MPATTRSRLPLIVGGAVVVIAVAVGAFLFLTRDKSDPPLKLSDATTTTGNAAPRRIDAAELDGSWKVVAGTGDNATVAGYRVREVFAAGSRKATANGRTNGVTGSLTMADGTVTRS